MQEEHLAGLCLALCPKRHLGRMKTSRGHERKHSARAERSTPDCAGAKALQDLSEMTLKARLLAVEPRGDTVLFCRLCAMQVGPVFSRIGRQELCMQESYRIVLYRWAQPPA